MIMANINSNPLTVQIIPHLRIYLREVICWKPYAQIGVTDLFIYKREIMELTKIN